MGAALRSISPATVMIISLFAVLLGGLGLSIELKERPLLSGAQGPILGVTHEPKGARSKLRVHVQTKQGPRWVRTPSQLLPHCGLGVGFVRAPFSFTTTCGEHSATDRGTLLQLAIYLGMIALGIALPLLRRRPK